MNIINNISSEILTNYSNYSNTNYSNTNHSSSYSYTGLIIGVVVFVSISIISIAIKIKCESGSDIFEFINIFK